MNEQSAKGAFASGDDFALGFQPDGVQLLHRDHNDWEELGKAPFNGDLRDGLVGFVKQLRVANAPGVALVIPEDQILYTDLVLPEATDTQAALKAGLDGLTPYPVDELAYDFSPADAKPGAKVKVAAVARQTLQEAEDFAVRHGFAPSRFVAAPASGQFPHAPDFGSTELAAEWSLASAEVAELSAAEPRHASEMAGAEQVASAHTAAPSAVGEVDTAASTKVEIVADPIALPEAAPQDNGGPAISRITSHFVVAGAASAGAGPALATKTTAASVNDGTIMLPGEAPFVEADKAAVVEETKEDSEAAEPEISAAHEPRPAKPLPERARIFHERASAARKARPVSDVPSRAAANGGKRSGLGGALPLVGLLVLGLGISAVMIGGDPEPAPTATERQAEVQSPDTKVIAAETETVPAVETQTPDNVAAAETQAVQADDVTNDTAVVAEQAATTNETSTPVSDQTGPDPVQVQAEFGTAVPTQQTAQTVPFPDDIAPLADAPLVAAQEAAIEAAVTAAYATAQMPEQAAEPAQELPTETQEAATPATTAPTRAASDDSSGTATAQDTPSVTRSARPMSRPANISQRSAPPSAPTAGRSSNQTASVAAAPQQNNRPASRPAASSGNNTTSSAPNPGAPDSATLVSSARPKSAPSRSEPASQTPDARPSVPRSPQPYEQRDRPEPTGTRPPPKPVTQSSVDGAVQHMLPAPRHFAMFSVRDHDAMLSHMDRPWIRIAKVAAPSPVRTAQTRPVRRPTRTDASTSAVDAAVSEAIGAERPAARSSTTAQENAAPAASAAAAPAAGSARISSSARPRQRPGTLTGAASASTAGISQATDSAVEQAIASAVDSSSAVPGRVALLPLTSSVRPSWRGNRSGGGNSSATDDAVSSAMANSGGTEGTLAPEPEQDAGESKAEAEAAALAERRRLDEELQRQAEQRVRERAASDARAAAQAKAAAEARARAQAEAEAAAAARRNQQYRPPEVDNEPEVASAQNAPANGRVTSSATTKGIDLNATQLIGTVGAGKASRGLIRLRNGRIVTVRLGDKINGGQISSIGNGGLKYVKAGREYSLPILNGR
ncbi:hypothetical protein [Paracoccus albus]|uniref:hypothetical protein n=1 Tax=Paracoccus albus TaxID=3017784 RepID=UPI0022F10F86|nr:hypothetical protein [Paracoccus albus]WBU60968.1 hypothetical protein PAF20_03340 [Paracoccus albus]